MNCTFPGKGCCALYSLLLQLPLSHLCSYNPSQGRNAALLFFLLVAESQALAVSNSVVFLNASGKQDNISDDLKAFLAYIKDKQILNDFAKEIDNEVQRVKHRKDWRQAYMTLHVQKLIWEQEAREEGLSMGREEGKLLGLIKVIRKQLDKGVDMETIADFLDVDIEFVKQVSNLLSKNPDATNEDVVKNLL